MTALVAASETASRTAPTPSSSIPARCANAATSRRIAPTPDGVDGNVASKETDTERGYPGSDRGYLRGLANALGSPHGRPGEAARRDERGDVPPHQRGDGDGAGPVRPAHVRLRVWAARMQPADPDVARGVRGAARRPAPLRGARGPRDARGRARHRAHRPLPRRREGGRPGGRGRGAHEPEAP